MRYPKDMRKEAKETKKGLMTISYTNPLGQTVTLQGLVVGKIDFFKEVGKFNIMVSDDWCKAMGKPSKGGE